MNEPLSPLSSQFLARVYTKNQGLKALRTIRDFVNYYFFELNEPSLDFKAVYSEFQVKNLSKMSNQYMSDEMKFITSLGEDFFKLFEKTSVANQLQELEQTLSNAKLVMLEVPFDIPESEIMAMSYWFRKTLGPNSLFEINFDPSLVGGCTISYNGKFQDYSLRKKISENKEKIVNTLRDFKGR